MKTAPAVPSTKMPNRQKGIQTKQQQCFVSRRRHNIPRSRHLLGASAVSQRAIMSRVAIDSANAPEIGFPPTSAEMPSQSQPGPTASSAAAAPRSTIPTSATPLQRQQFKNEIISPNRANAAVALSALFRSEPAPAEVANASAIVAQQVCLPSLERWGERLVLIIFNAGYDTKFAEFYWFGT